ncbi:hypothetical protein [Nitriliruptor alkaliphilus]|uniref:hypothetical protein n=1 Tax=Nitriliruptor alkaliphilus TaxID=427918 RepID=UPI0006971192|nr:hypothetical protein [Nitriliruptor alkaliphilus]
MSETDLTGALREEVGQLTAGPLADFVAARTARARELKAAGQVDLARELGGRRKPTVPAWGLDQLAHHHPDELDALFAAADRVRSTQTVADPDRDAVRAASTAFTSQVRRLRSLAGDRLAAAGTAPEAHLDEVEATLLAAATDGTVAADLRAGALLRPAPSPGFAALASLSPPTGRGRARTSHPKPGSAAPEPAETDGSDARRAAELEAIRSRRAELADRQDDAETAVRRAADAVEAARTHLAELQSEIERLQRDATAAAEELAATEGAEREVRQAADELAAEVDALDRQAEEIASGTG